MPYLDLPPDLNLYYEIDDYTDAWRKPESVLLVHGANENIDAWRAWVPHLSRQYRVIRIDQRGFGKSGAVPDGFTYTTDLFVDDFVRVINRLSDDAVHVVGGKSGGINVIKLAATRPDLVKTLTLASTPILPPKAHGWVDHMQGQGMRSWVRSTMRKRLGSAMPERGIDWWVDLMGSTALSTMQAYLQWVGTIDVRPDLAHIKCPVLVITTESPYRDKAEVEAYRKHIRNLELKVMATDGYHAAGAEPDNSARATLEFMNRHRSPL
jgi:3-oxoadipate enol-lactonase